MAEKASSYLLSSDRRPLYIRAAEAIQALIVDSGLVAGDRIPSEFDLTAILGVGRSTIRESVGYLETEGLLRRHRGVGTVVMDRSALAVGLEALEAVEALAARQGYTCQTSDLNISVESAPGDAARRLRINLTDPVTVISRIKSRDGAAFAEMVSYVPDSVVPASILTAGFRESITEFFLQHHGLTVRRAMAEVTAISADRRRARRLAIRVGSPLLLLDELFLGEVGQPLAWNLLYFVPGMIKLEVVRRPRSRTVRSTHVDRGTVTS